MTNDTVMYDVLSAADELLEYPDAPVRLARLAQAVKTARAYRAENCYHWPAKVLHLEIEIPSQWDVWTENERLWKALKSKEVD